MGGPAISLMVGTASSLQVEAFMKHQPHPDAPSIPKQVKQTLEQFQGTSPLLFFFPDAFQHHPYNFVNTFNYVKTHPMVFGAAACDDGLRQTSVEMGPEGWERFL